MRNILQINKLMSQADISNQETKASQGLFAVRDRSAEYKEQAGSDLYNAMLNDQMESQRYVRQAFKLAHSIEANKFNRLQQTSQQTKSVFFSPQQRNEAQKSNSTMKSRSSTVEVDVQMILQQMSQHKLRFSNGKTLDLTQTDLIGQSQPRQPIPPGYQNLNTPKPNFLQLLDKKTSNQTFTSEISSTVSSGHATTKFKFQQRKLSEMAPTIKQTISPGLLSEQLNLNTASSAAIILPSLTQNKTDDNQPEGRNQKTQNLRLDFPMQGKRSSKYSQNPHSERTFNKVSTKNLILSSRDQVNKIVEKRIWQVLKEPQLDKRVTMNQFAQQEYYNNSREISSDEDFDNQIHKKTASPIKSELNSPSEKISTQQLKEIKRKQKREKELQRREEEKLAYQEKVKLGLIVPLTKEESAAKIKFFTLAREQRALERELEQQRLLNPEPEINAEEEAKLNSKGKSGKHSSSKGKTDLNNGGVSQKTLVSSPSKAPNTASSKNSEHPSVIYTEKDNPQFKFRLPKIPSGFQDIYQNTLHSFFSQATTPVLSKKLTKQTTVKASKVLMDDLAEQVSEEDQKDGPDEEPNEDQVDTPAEEQQKLLPKTDKKKLLLKMIEEEKKEAEEHLEVCGEDFLFAISRMIQDIENSNQNDAQNFGNVQRLNKMLETGNSSKFSILLNKNVDSDIPQQAIQGFQNLIKRQNAFYRLVKKAQDSKFSELAAIDAKLSYFSECEKNQVLCTPYLHKIIDGKLVIRSRTINEGLCTAIKVVLGLAPNLLHSLTLDQNGMDGDEMLQMLLGVQSQAGTFKSLTIQNNTVDEKCMDIIIDLVKRRLPDNLEQLNLYYCRLYWKETEKLLMEMKSRCQLSSLSLVQASLNEFSMPYLEEIVRSQKRLTYLDISWNSLVPKMIKPLLVVLSKNRRLQYINLGWNNIILQQQSEKEQLEVAFLLSQLIKYNKQLLHLDITCTGLTNLIITELGNALRRAGSLLAIHLSGNPGLTLDNRSFLVKRIRCQPLEDTNRFLRIGQAVQNATKDLPKNFVEGIMEQVRRGQKFEKRDFNPVDQIVLQRIIGFKDQQPGIAQWYESSPEAVPTKKHAKSECWICAQHVYSVLFWSRGRAYKLSPIIGKESSQLICFEIDRIDLAEDETEDDPGIGYVKGNLPYDQLKDKEPYIAASFTGWRYKKMIPLHEFTKSLDKEVQDPFEKAKDEGYVRRKIHFDEMSEREVAWLKVVEAFERKRYRVQWAKFFKKYLAYKKPYLINSSQFENIDDEIDLLNEQSDEKLELKILDSEESDNQKQNQTVPQPKKKEKKRNADGETEPEEEPLPVPPDESKWDIVYCLPFFAKPGKHNYMIKYKNTQEKVQKSLIRRKRKVQLKLEAEENDLAKEIFQDQLDQIGAKLQPEVFFYNCHVIERVEPIPILTKQMKSNTTERKFNKETSVFKLWIQDTPQKTVAMFEHDFNFWKLPRLISKNFETEIPACKQLVLQHADFLKETFVNLISQSSYPALTKNEFSAWCHQTKIQEGVVNLATVDRCFIAANTSQEAKFCTIGGALCRFEFLEAIVRLAQQKYLNQGITKTFAESFEKILTEKIIPLSQNQPWQSFRDTELWTIGVNDILEANLDGLKKIYNSYLTVIKPQINYDDIIQICTRECELNVPTQDLLFCYGMSKMSVISESQNYKQYFGMAFVEFLEFIGRIAHFKFKASPDISGQPLAQKIEYILDDLMPAFGLVKNEVNIQIEENSESDDDY